MSVNRVHRLPGLDPWDHLAREEVLLDHLDPGASALVLYVNRPCLVLGKHQNPLREVRLDEAARRGVPLVRRASGGGTVWHDEGNLNWAWMGPKEGYDRDGVSHRVAEALAPLGRALVVGDKGDLFWDGKKVSGAAYLVRRDRILHHGTLLCRAHLEDLRGVLGTTGALDAWVGVSSRPSPVTNLDCDVATVAASLVATFGGSQVSEDQGLGDAEFEHGVQDRAEGLRSDQWLWDQTPPFTWTGQTKVGTVTVTVRGGLVESIEDDRSRNLSKMVGKRFFTAEFFDYIRSREGV